MNSCVAYDFYRIFNEDSFVLIYGGHFNDSVLINSTEIVKKIIPDDKSFERYRNKMIFLMIEAFQNVIRYAEIDNSEHTDLLSKLFVSRKIGGEIYVATSNIIENYKIKKVTEKIEKINEYDEKSLKKEFIDVLTNRQFSDKGGAGLGFIEMSRKTKAKLEHKFVTINEDLSHFYFLTKLKFSAGANGQPSKMDIDSCKDLHATVSKENILLLLKNDFTEEMTAAVLSVVEQNLKQIELRSYKRIFHLLVEAIQNVSKHSALRDGRRQSIVLITNKDNTYTISTGNMIENKNIPNLKNTLDNFEKMSKKELSSIYVSKLIDEKSTEIGGIGIIDIIRETDDFCSDFIEIDKNFSFFVFKIKINIDD